jgi:hypothetical protein
MGRSLGTAETAPSQGGNEDAIDADKSIAAVARRDFIATSKYSANAQCAQWQDRRRSSLPLGATTPALALSRIGVRFRIWQQISAQIHPGVGVVCGILEYGSGHPTKS